MFFVLGFVIGFALGWIRAGTLKGSPADKLQYGAGFGIGLGLLFFVASLILVRIIGA